MTHRAGIRARGPLRALLVESGLVETRTGLDVRPGWLQIVRHHRGNVIVGVMRQTAERCPRLEGGLQDVGDLFVRHLEETDTRLDPIEL